MAKTLQHQIVDMVTLAATGEPFAVTYDLPNGGQLSVARPTASRNSVQHRFLSTAIVDVYGAHVEVTVDNWQTTYDVADRLAVLHEG